MTDMITALVVEDNAVLAEATATLIERSDTPVDHANSETLPEKAIPQIDSHDILILDIRFKERRGNGIDLIQRSPPEVPTVVYTYHRKHWYVQTTNAAGADAYVWKSEKGNAGIVEAVNSVLEGETYISDEIKTGLEFGEGYSAEDLPGFQQDALRAIASSADITEAAKKIDVSPDTMYTYRTNIANRLGLESAKQLDQVAQLLT